MSLYEALIKFKNGEISPYDVEMEDGDGVIDISRVNKNNLGKSMVTLKFTEEEYRDLFLGEKGNYQRDNNESLIDACESRYSSGVFVDYYWGKDEVSEGYVLHYFNEENINLVRQILKIINPPLAKFELGTMTEEVGRFLWKAFQNNMEEIADFYPNYYDDALRAGLLEYVNNKLYNKFNNFGIIEKTPGQTYITTVTILLNFWDSTGIDKEKGIIDALKQFVSDNDLELDEDLYEDYYAYFDLGNFDDEGFNKDVNRQLEQIYEKITEEMTPEDIQKMKSFYEILDKLNIQIDRWSFFPKQKTFGEPSKKQFRVIKFDDGLVYMHVSDHQNHYPASGVKVPLEDFYDFLYHPELF